MVFLAIAIGGAVGSLVRYYVGYVMQSHVSGTFPWGTLVINVVGSFLIGFLYHYLDGVTASPYWRPLLGIGFCGGFTTFSTFSLETIRLMQTGQSARAFAYVTASVLVSLAACGAGWGAAGSVVRRG